MHHTRGDMHHKPGGMHHKTPVMQHTQGIEDEEWALLMDLAGAARASKRLDLEPLILGLCRGRYLKKDQIVKLLVRTEASLRNHYLTPLVRDQKLELLQPNKPRSPA